MPSLARGGGGKQTSFQPRILFTFQTPLCSPRQLLIPPAPPPIAACLAQAAWKGNFWGGGECGKDLAPVPVGKCCASPRILSKKNKAGEGETDCERLVVLRSKEATPKQGHAEGGGRVGSTHPVGGRDGGSGTGLRFRHQAQDFRPFARRRVRATGPFLARCGMTQGEAPHPECPFRPKGGGVGWAACRLACQVAFPLLITTLGSGRGREAFWPCVPGSQAAPHFPQPHFFPASVGRFASKGKILSMLNFLHPVHKLGTCVR